MALPRQVIVIMTDTQRWDMVNCYRRTGLQTPQLDRLAAAGVRFERAYTCQPVCGPARAALFTGTYPHSNGSWTNHLPLGAGIPHVGQRVRDGGIKTAHIGKWHLDASDYFGLGAAPDGWDPATWYDMRNYLEELSPEDRLRSRNTSTVWENVDETLTFGHRCSNRAIDFLNRNTGEDFLLVLSYDEPHGPYLCPRRYAEAYRNYAFPETPNRADTLADKPEHLQVWAQQPFMHGYASKTSAVRPEYFGCNTFVDHEIGRVLDVIDRQCPDALVIYTSDHGDMMRAHRLNGKGPAMFDEITRIPLLVRWPGHAPVGAVCTHPVSHIDLTPTVLGAFGLSASPVIEGKSLLPTIVNPAQRASDAVFMEFGRYEVDHDAFGGFQLIRCVFDGRFKLAINLLTSDEFYDLQEDPHEMKNLIASEVTATERNRLHDRLLEWMNQTRDPFRGYYWERRPWRTDARPASWAYTGGIRQIEGEPGRPLRLEYTTALPANRPRKT